MEVPHVIVGGVAASILGRPRATADIDVAVLLGSGRWGEFLQAAHGRGFIPRLSDPLAFARDARVLLLRHASTETNVDLILAALPFEQEMIARGRAIEIAGVSVRLPTPEDLLVTKAVAHRARDVADIDAVLDANPGLDLRRVRRWVRAFAQALDEPALIDDFETHLRRRRGGRRS